VHCEIPQVRSDKPVIKKRIKKAEQKALLSYEKSLMLLNKPKGKYYHHLVEEFLDPLTIKQEDLMAISSS